MTNEHDFFCGELILDFFKVRDDVITTISWGIDIETCDKDETQNNDEINGKKPSRTQG